MADEIKPGETPPAPELTTPPEPVVTPPETIPPVEPTPPDPSEPMVETKRFTGAIQKIQTLTEELRGKDQELAALNTQIEHDKMQTAVKDAETQAGYSERDKQLETALLEKTKIESDTAVLKSKLAKIEIAKELGHPELISIIDTIPTFEDADLQKKAMEDILGFADVQVKEREKSLLSGLTPALTPTPVPGEALPASNDAWKKSIADEPDDVKRKALFDKWWNWRQENPEKPG